MPHIISDYCRAYLRYESKLGLIRIEMSKFIYLDQNVLSDMRRRKRNKDQDICELFGFIAEKRLKVLYSLTHLEEIYQIAKQEYRQEHIDLLCELDGAFISPNGQGLDFRSPQEVWEEFLLNSKQEFDYEDPEEILMDIGKKISGIDVGYSFEDIHNRLQKALLSIADDIESEDLGTETERLKAKRMADLIREQTRNMDRIDIDDSHLGADRFRSWLSQRGLTLEDLNAEDVIPAIKATIYQNQESVPFTIDGQENDVRQEIIKCYTMMNWAGYHPDDFTSTKKGKDRFRAASNDSQHVQEACTCHYLVSSDSAFIMKAGACYAYIGSDTLCLSPRDLVQVCL